MDHLRNRGAGENAPVVFIEPENPPGGHLRARVELARQADGAVIVAIDHQAEIAAVAEDKVVGGLLQNGNLVPGVFLEKLFQIPPRNDMVTAGPRDDCRRAEANNKNGR